jgi:predicted SAM-dependent methyltransferase
MILNEWKRVLKPGGILRLATPDFEAISKLYVEGKIKLEQILGPVYGKMEGNRNFIYHRTTYDFNSLSQLLSEVGFKDIKHYNWWETEHAEHDDHSMAHIPHMDKENGTLISLNVECTK